jgi:RNA methyltransferase, TrmH family
MTITSKDNEKLKLVRKLADRKHREREGLFVTEGEDLLQAGIAAGYEPHLVLTRAGERLGGEEVERDLLDSVSQLGSGTRAVAIWPLPAHARPELGDADVRSGRAGVWVYLHGVGDPGNVGSIVRSAAALGAARVVLGPGCADAYSPRALRASMGAVFNINVGRGRVEDTPRPRLALVAHGGAPEPADGTATVCLGAEREGLPDEITAACDGRWTIPVREKVESLGVAAAGAIALSRIGSLVPESG